MKTDTRDRILAYIRQKRAVRAKEICQFVGLSSQMVFRHLKQLIKDGVIDKRGAAPRVEYFAIFYNSSLANNSVVYLKNMNVFNWAEDKLPTDPPADFYCQSSDVWQGRFSRVEPTLTRNKFDIAMVAFLASAIGEIGDNCFTHNAPSWIDTRGCWYEFDLNKDRSIKVIIADRGRGILTSLKAVRPALASHKDALLVALTEPGVTGRAPELRGNGLKHVMSVLTKLPRGNFKYQTGNAVFECALPLDKNKIAEYIKETSEFIRGTYCEINVTL